jgi:biofilm PGA synthesis protein PgaA
VYLQSLDNAPDNLDALVSLVRIYLETDQKPAIEPILSQMQTLADQHPQQPRYRHELLQILAWLERDQDALQQAQQIDMQTAPIYVLETAGRSARNLRNFPLAENLFQQAAVQDPQRLTPKLAQAWLLLDQQKNLEAINYLQQLRESFPNSVELLLTQANAHSFASQYPEAVEQYQHVLEIAPTQPEAERGLAFSLANAGKVDQALTQANSHRPLFSDEEWTGLKWRHAAEQIRQGEQALSIDPRDYRATDQAINELQENIALTEKLQLPDPTLWQQRAQFDLLVALRDRRRMADTISLYQQLLQQNTALPVYARMAAADAYLNNRNPQQARDLYLGVLQEVPDYFNAKASLTYAYLEAEQLDLALQTAENLANEQPKTITSRSADGSETQIDNPNKVTADLLAALFPAYVDDLKTAQIRLEQLHLQHPDNTNIHSKLAEIYYYRGWPLKAQREIEQAQIKSPEHFGLKLTQAKVAHELRDYPQEAAITYDLYRDYPEDSGTIKQMQAWKKHNKPELKIFASGGFSKNEPQANNDFVSSNEAAIDGYLYSPPIEKNFRVFAHEGWRTGLFKESRGYLLTHGAGVEYAKDEAVATAEVHYDNFQSSAVGVDLGLDYQLNDQWQLFTRLSSLDNNISLRALSSEEATVTAKSARVGATYRVNESRYFRLSGNYYNFSDDNNRFGGDFAYYERWYSGPIYKFATYLNLGYSTNTLPANGFYFSPKQDAIASITFDNDWLTYRNYETDFHQRVAVTVGDYWQQDYGSNMVGNIQYEHRWRLGTDIELNYGAARNYRYFDDALTESWLMYLSADIRF